MDERYLNRLYKVKRGEIRMMRLRGYDISSVALYVGDNTWQKNTDMRPLIDLSFEEFLKLPQDLYPFRDRREFSSIYYKSSSPDESVIIIYTDPNGGKPASTAAAAFAFAVISSGQFKHIIIISENGLDSMHNTIVEKEVMGRKVELFTDKELVILATEHAYAPISIEYIKKEETEKWAEREGIVAKDLPLIEKKDAIAKVFGANVAEIFQAEVVNADGTVGIFSRRVRD